jgi:hypothetical protein
MSDAEIEAASASIAQLDARNALEIERYYEMGALELEACLRAPRPQYLEFPREMECVCPVHRSQVGGDSFAAHN